ncbi:hypothetical protein RFI_33799, partial [Reticulomyxa filosa]
FFILKKISTNLVVFMSEIQSNLQYLEELDHGSTYIMIKDKNVKVDLIPECKHTENRFLTCNCGNHNTCRDCDNKKIKKEKFWEKVNSVLTINSHIKIAMVLFCSRRKFTYCTCSTKNCIKFRESFGLTKFIRNDTNKVSIMKKYSNNDVVLMKNLNEQMKNYI